MRLDQKGQEFGTNDVPVHISQAMVYYVAMLCIIVLLCSYTLRKTFQKDVKLEMKENCVKQKRMEGTPIFYGDNIQLQHTLTRKYLATSTMETSRTEYTKLKVHKNYGW